MAVVRPGCSEMRGSLDAASVELDNGFLEVECLRRCVQSLHVE